MDENIIDTKLVWCRDGFLYQLTRTRRGIMDTLSISYPMKAGQKTVSKRIISPLGWLCQKSLELAVDLV